MESPTQTSPLALREIAWLEHEGQIFYTNVKVPAANEPGGAVLALVQAVWELTPRTALRVLRERIYTTAPERALDRAVIQVAAKRLTAGATWPEWDAARATELTPLTQRLARRLLSGGQPSKAESPPVTMDHWRGKAVTAVLFGSDPLLPAPDGTRAPVLARARSDSTRNRTLHAELVLAQRFWLGNLGPLPRGAVLVTTLQCCRMCAAALYRLAYGTTPPESADPGVFQVRYLERDPGPKAQDTLLARAGLEAPWQGPLKFLTLFTDDLT